MGAPRELLVDEMIEGLVLREKQFFPEMEILIVAM
jgi:hypothetical protein